MLKRRIEATFKFSTVNTYSLKKKSCNLHRILASKSYIRRAKKQHDEPFGELYVVLKNFIPKCWRLSFVTRNDELFPFDDKTSTVHFS